MPFGLSPRQQMIISLMRGESPAGPAQMPLNQSVGQMKPAGMQPANLPYLGGPPPMTARDQLAINAQREAPVEGMDQIMRAQASSPGVALAQALAAATSGHYGRKQNEADATALEETIAAEREAALAAQREKDDTELLKWMAEYQQRERGMGDKAPTTREVKRRDDAGNEIIVTEEFVDGQWTPVGMGDRFAPPSNTTVNVGKDAVDKYSETRAKEAAEYMGERRKTADQAVKSRAAMQRFLAASKDGREGGAGPVISTVENFLTTFGYDSAELEDVALMTQAVNSVQANYMRELGARGLTDRDMEILANSLPKVESSREAREAVANVMIKLYNNDIHNYITSLEEETEHYKDDPNFRAPPKPYWLDDERSSERYQLWLEAKGRGLL